VRKEGNHPATAIRAITKRTGEISSLHKIFVEIAFGKHFYNM